MLTTCRSRMGPIVSSLEILHKWDWEWLAEFSLAIPREGICYFNYMTFIFPDYKNLLMSVLNCLKAPAIGIIVYHNYMVIFHGLIKVEISVAKWSALRIFLDWAPTKVKFWRTLRGCDIVTFYASCHSPRHPGLKNASEVPKLGVGIVFSERLSLAVV